MVMAKVDDESLLASSFSSIKLDNPEVMHERNRSGESSKSNKSSSDSSQEDRPKSPSLWIDVSQNRYIMLEWAQNGDLFDFTLGIQQPLGEQLAR